MNKRVLLTLFFLFLSSCYSGETEKPFVYNGCGLEGRAVDSGSLNKYNVFFWAKFSF